MVVVLVKEEVREGGGCKGEREGEGEAEGSSAEGGVSKINVK